MAGKKMGKLFRYNAKDSRQHAAAKVATAATSLPAPKAQSVKRRNIIQMIC